jgi:acyl-CoA synthetase (NDP forming)/GNAT superfamily N-acetyltransferase
MPALALDPFFRPRCVAVLGASARPGSVGSILVRNLLESPFGGILYPINPRRRAVHGVRCYPDLAALPEGAHLAVIATPAATVPDLVRQCVERGVPAGILISAGFSERGAEGQALEQQVREIARGKMRLIGPNCLGVIHPPSNLNASFAASMARPGRVALLSQSGAICMSVLDWAREANVGFSAFVSVGGMLDVDFADLLDYFADDPATRSIVLYMESLGDVRKFLSAARSAARTRQVIVVKSGRRDAGTDAVFDAAFRRAGVLRVTTIGELFNMAEILAMQPPPRGPALAVLSNAGGPAAMAADALLLDGGELATLSSETMAALDAILPPFWGRANPVNLLWDAGPERYRQAVESCLTDANVQGLLVLLAPQAMTTPTETARQVASVAAAHKGTAPPLLACWLGGESVREGRGLLNQAGVPTFDSPESAIRAFLNMVRYRRSQELLYERPESIPEDAQPDTARVRQIIQTARAQGRTVLNEAEAKDVLAAYGVAVGPMVRETGYGVSVGSSVDRQFGPIIRFGAGGALAEVFGDRALALPPLNRTLARRLMERTKIYRALQGTANLEALESLLVRFSRLLADVLDIQEVDLSPVLALATPAQVVVLGARVVLTPADLPQEQRPRLAIHPYPNQYTAPFRLRNGTEVVVRAIRPEDEPLIIGLHARHSERTIRMRFFSLVKVLSRDSLIRLCHLDYDREMALVAVVGEGEQAQIVGVSRYYLCPETGEAEFALVVGDAHQGQGLGRHLMERLIAIARERGVKRLVGQVLRDNAPMLALTASLGLSPPRPIEDGVVEVGLALA